MFWTAVSALLLRPLLRFLLEVTRVPVLRLRFLEGLEGPAGVGQRDRIGQTSARA